MTKHTSEKIQIDLPTDVLVKERARPRSLGMTLSEYMKSLVDKDVAAKEDPWRQPVPPEVNARWEKEIAEFDEQEKIKPRPSAKTAYELIKRLDEEAALLSDDEGN